MRPFQNYIEREPGLPMVELRGEIRDRIFVVTVFGQDVPLDTVEIGEDSFGPFAVVAECVRELKDGFKLRAEVEHDQDDPPGGGIHVFLAGARSAPHERSFVVYFHASGHVDGNGVGYKSDGKRPTRAIN